MSDDDRDEPSEDAPADDEASGADDDDEAAAPLAAAAAPEKPDAGADAKTAASEPPPPAKRRRISWWWLLPAAMLVEFYIYGHNGYIDVCVGKEGQTDFTLVGKPRTDDNRWKFPRCERRTNLGLRSTYDEKLADGVAVACRQATLFRFQGEAKACEAGDKGWVHQVDTSFCPPWDPNYYEHLFWFLQ